MGRRSMQPYEKIRRRTPSEVAVSALAPERAPSTDFSLSATPFHFFSQRLLTERTVSILRLEARMDQRLQHMAHLTLSK